VESRKASAKSQPKFRKGRETGNGGPYVVRRGRAGARIGKSKAPPRRKKRDRSGAPYWAVSVLLLADALLEI
jgi:hypothetical protein